MNTPTSPKPIHYTLTREAYLTFSVYCLNKSDFMRKQMNLTRFLPLGLTVIACIVFYAFNMMRAFWPALIVVVIYGAFSFMLPGIMWKSTAKRMGKLIDEGFGSEYLGEHVLTFEGAGLTDTTDKGSATYLYTAIEKCIEHEDQLYLMLGPSVAFILPLGVWESDAERAAFLAWLRDRGAFGGR